MFGVGLAIVGDVFSYTILAFDCCEERKEMKNEKYGVNICEFSITSIKYSYGFEKLEKNLPIFKCAIV